MPNVLILTDAAVQFTNSHFAGIERVHVMPWQAGSNSSIQAPEDVIPFDLASLPLTLHNRPFPVMPPDPNDFFQALTTLGQQAHEIIIILTSAHLSTAFQSAQKTLETIHCPAALHLVDSQNIGAGLGFLVQAAARAVSEGETGIEVYRYLRKLVPHTYSMFCAQSLTYISQGGHLDPTQAIVGEMLNLMPFFLLENGRLTPVQKARSTRQLVEVVNEFVEEFENLLEVAVVYGLSPFEQEARSLHDRLSTNLPGCTISQHPINEATAAVLGPRSLGISVIEEIDL
jgi:DegV family protein with EDD domain